MKTTRKIIVFVLMLAVIFSAMGMFAVSASAEDSGTIRVYFENNWGWTDIRVHYWGGSSSSDWNSLPKMIDSGLTNDSGTKIYYYDIPADTTGMMFKRADGDGRATWDVTNITPCTIWYMEWDGNDDDGKDNAKSYKSDKVHTYEAKVTTEATCGKAGVKTYTCSACKSSYTEAIPALPDHNYVDGACTVCGGADPSICLHANKTQVTVEPTCTEDGKSYLDCDSCDEIFDLVVTDKLGHNYSTNGVCQRCGTGDIYTVAGSSSLLGVQWDPSSVDNEMVYDSTNNIYTKTYTGIKNGNYEFKVVLGHDWGSEYPADNYKFTLTEDNCTVVITFDPTTKKVEATAEHVHDWADATCTAPKTCKIASCGITEGESLGGHNFVDGECTKCGEKEIHVCSFSDATCTEPAKCKCGATQGKALGHDYDVYGACSRCDADLVHTVVGVGALCGDTTPDNSTDGWDIDNTANNLLFDAETGVYSITYENLTAGTYTFKVVKNFAWEGAYGGDGQDGNYVVSVSEGSDLVISIVDGKLVVKEIFFTLDSAVDYYLVPGNWSSDNANFAIYWFDQNSDKTGWVEMTKVDGHSYYLASVPAGASHIIYVRIDPNAEEINWDAKWNQSGNIAVSAEGGTYLFTAFGEGEGASDTVEAHKHSYTSAVTAPTCTVDGYTTYTCACGDSYTDNPVDALTHDWADATCTAPKTCKRTGCGATDGEKLGHDLTVYPAVDPTCTEKGLTAGEKCNRTGCTHNVPQTELAANAHDFDEWTVTTEATEDTKGEKRRDCKNCDHYETDVVPELNHDCSRWETDPIPAVPATCTTPGSTAGTKCSECGATVQAPEPIPALNHNLVDDAAVAPTCTEEGLTAGKHCTRCDYKVAQEAVAALGHDMTTDAAVAPTCTEAGLTEGSHCSRCDHKVAQEVVAALGHTEVVDNAVAATCTEAGKTEGKHCSTCNAVTVAQETVEALGHTEVVDAAVESTCTKTGLTEGKHCSICNEVLVAQKTVSIKPHSYAEGKCSVCGATDPDYVAPHEHNFVEGKCECGETDPNYVAPTPDPEPGLFESIWQAIVEFFKAIGDFFAGLFGGNKE